ncbi:MAG: hypothetical protein V2I40_09075 [Desulfobacteraceae bacterium]|jgi:hypothetical protein|nr:hypothetical protein [Desulfobacteraceae bacterium]
MKTFYTVRDIEDMHAAGVAEIDIHDDVVLTDVAREKAIALGLRLIPVEQAAEPRRALTSGTFAAGSSDRPGPASSPSLPSVDAGAPRADLVLKIKKAVADRLGTDKYNDALDVIIPQVMAKLKK